MVLGLYWVLAGWTGGRVFLVILADLLADWEDSVVVLDEGAPLFIMAIQTPAVCFPIYVVKGIWIPLVPQHHFLFQRFGCPGKTELSFVFEGDSTTGEVELCATGWEEGDPAIVLVWEGCDVLVGQFICIAVQLGW